MIDWWKKPCQARTRIITSIDISFGPHTRSFTVATLGDYPDLLSLVLSHLPRDLQLGVIKPRFSRTQNRSYFSNGCQRCDAIIGENYESNAWNDERMAIAIFPTSISERWQAAISGKSDKTFGWAVYLSRGEGT